MTPMPLVMILGCGFTGSRVARRLRKDGVQVIAIRRAEERVLVDRVMWLATGAPHGQVRAIASFKLQKLAARLLKGVGGATEADQAQHALLAADIRRFLDRPAETMKAMPTADAPPGAPIGDAGMDWLQLPPR